MDGNQIKEYISEKVLMKIIKGLFIALIFFFPYSMSLRNILLGLLFIFYLIAKTINFKIEKTQLNKYIMLFFIFSILSFFNSNNLKLSLETLISPIFKYIAFYFMALDLISNLNLNKYFNTLFYGNLGLLLSGLLVEYYTKIDVFYRDNDMGTLTAIIFIFFISLFFIKEDKLYKKIMVFLGIIGVIIAFVLTYSRGATLALLGSFVVWVILVFWKRFRNKLNKKILFGSIVIVLIIILISTPFILPDRLINRFQRMKNIDSSWSLKLRVYMWESSLWMIKNNPLVGVGLGNFRSNFLYYIDEVKQTNIPKSARGHIKPHNLYLHIALEQGVISLILFLIMGYKVIKKGLVDFWYSQKGSLKEIISLSLIGGIISVAIHSFVDTTFLYGNVGLYIILLFVFSLKLDKNLLSNDEMGG